MYNSTITEADGDTDTELVSEADFEEVEFSANVFADFVDELAYLWYWLIRLRWCIIMSTKVSREGQIVEMKKSVV